MSAWLAACGAEHFNQASAEGDAAAYDAIYPHYAVFCTLSEIKKKPGFGADIRGLIGGHSVFYLNGAGRDPDLDYPVLQASDPTGDPRTDGVGISMNAHFSNARWAAVPGRAFFFSGGLRRDQPLTHAGYVHVLAEAKQLDLYRDVTFHAEAFEDKPKDMSRDYYKYKISVATDYAVSFGRARYCTRVPVRRAQMAQIVAYLNAQNAPYRDGDRRLDWKLFQDDCRHLARNALSAAGIWPVWRPDMPLLIAMFDFPVPKNEFVDLVQRSNDPATLVRWRCTRTRIRDATCCGSVDRHGGQVPWSQSRRRRSRTRSMTPIPDWRSTTIVFCNRIDVGSTRSSASHAISTSSRICGISPRCSGG